MSRLLLGAALAVLVVRPVMAVQTPESEGHDPRVRYVVYDPANVVRIVGNFRTSIEVSFAEDESVYRGAIGDATEWELVPTDNIVFLKPRETTGNTNLQIVTTRPDGRKRSYQFELIAPKTTDTTEADAVFAVRFLYPQDEAAKEQALAARKAEELRKESAAHEIEAKLAATPTLVTARNVKYSAQGFEALEPTEAYDDGPSTYLRFPGTRELPAVFIVTPDGTEGAVDRDVRGDLIVVHAIAQELRLRRGSKVLSIYNEAWDPSAPVTSTGTVRDDVSRVLTATGNPEERP